MPVTMVRLSGPCGRLDLDGTDWRVSEPVGCVFVVGFFLAGLDINRCSLK